MFYRINWHAATRRVLLETGANSAPAAIGGTGMTDLDTFEHDNEAEESTSRIGIRLMNSLVHQYFMRGI